MTVRRNDQGHVRMPEPEFEAILTHAAEREACAGRCRARRRRGRARHPRSALARRLHDCIRLVRRTAMQTAVRMITTGVMLALLAGIAIKLKIFGGSP